MMVQNIEQLLHGFVTKLVIHFVDQPIHITNEHDDASYKTLLYARELSYTTSMFHNTKANRVHKSKN